MRQTLFTIDHYLFENHWILIGWLILGMAFMAYQFFWGNKTEAGYFLPVYAVGAMAIHFVVPKLETLGVNPADPNGPMVPDGLAIRGYGVFMLLAMVCGIGLCVYRCRQVGYDFDKLLSLTFWMVVIGIIGARLFYVIQKYDSFAGLAAGDLMFALVDMTSGGLVVYGSLIGGVLAASVYMWRNKMPWRQVVDILAPGMVLGLAIGRIGCLMNGCCYGGVCEASYPGVYFPAASPPYIEQLSSGELLGIQGTFDEKTYQVAVESVEPESLAAEYGVKSGDTVRVFLNESQGDIRLRAAKEGMEMNLDAVVDRLDDDPIFIPVSKLPDDSLRTHPTQIYSAVNAFLLTAFLWFYFPFRKRRGEVFALMCVIYPVCRFLLELIRTDELGAFGTPFTGSQLVSICLFVAGLGLFAYVRTRPE